jgi:hypothetical protein
MLRKEFFGENIPEFQPDDLFQIIPPLEPPLTRD